MLRALWFAVKIGLFVAVVTWLVERPGVLSFDLYDYHVNVSTGLALATLFLTLLVILAIHRVIVYLGHLPVLYRQYREKVERQKGERSLVLGMTSVAAGDAELAGYHAHRANKFLPKGYGLVLLLEGQSARLKGDEDKAQKAFIKLLKNKDTAFLGLRGLLMGALEKNDFETAGLLMDKAIKMHPKQPWVLRMAYDLELRRRHWIKAGKLLKKIEKCKALPEDRIQNDKAALYIQQADEDRMLGQSRHALHLLKQAHKVSPSFIPAALHLAHYHVDQGQMRAAKKVIEETWKQKPHPGFVALWKSCTPEKYKQDSAKMMRWMEDFVALNPDSDLAQIAAAEQAIYHRLWGPAKQYLERAESLRPSARLYKAWAHLEEAQDDPESANHYFEKAVEAPADKVWTCRETGRIYDSWSPVAEPHGSFNTIIWGYPEGTGKERPLLSAGNDLIVLS